METAFATKSEEKKKSRTSADSSESAGISLGTAVTGATQGMPLFLQRAPLSLTWPSVIIQREREEEAKDEDLQEKAAIQTKLTIGQPGDIYEQEADRVANTAIRMPVSTGGEYPSSPSGTEAPHVQRKCATCGASNCSCGGVIQKDNLVQTKALPGGAVQLARSPLYLPDSGTPLSSTIRGRVEPLLGADLSQVRVHTSPTANKVARSLQAKAFTHQNHIWLGPSQSSDDAELMAHETAHVVQQTAGADASSLVQRKGESPQAVEDGAEVRSRLQQQINEALGSRSPTFPPTPSAPTPAGAPDAAPSANATAAVNPEARRAVQQMDRSELMAKTAEIQPSARPSVDRAAEQQPRVEEAAKTTEEALDKPPEQKAEGKGEGASEAAEGGQNKGAGKTAVAAADQAANMADQAFSIADSQPVPDQPVAVVPPTPVAPVDAGGMPLPDNPEMDDQLLEMANQAQELREQGQNQRAHATEGTANTEILRGNLQLIRQSVGQSESGVQTAQGHLEFRRGLLSQARQALTVSEQKAATLSQQAPGGVSEAARGKERSGPLASESRDLVGQNNANTPDDPEAAQRTQEQGGKLNQVSSDAASIDDTLTQVHGASNTLVQDAAHATQVNTQTRGRVDGMEATLQQTDARLGVMQEHNSQARAQLDAAQQQPVLLQAEASSMDAQGQDMIATSLDIENRIHQAQQRHAAGMQAVPAVEPLREETQTPSAEEPSIGDQSVSLEQPQAMVAEQQALLETPSVADQSAATELSASPVEESSVTAIQTPETALLPVVSAPDEEGVIQRQEATTATPSQTVTPAPQPSNINIARGVPSWLTGEPEPNAADRQAAQEREEARRRQEIEEINAIARERGGFDRLSAAERRRIAFRLSMQNTFGGLSNISWPGLGGIARGAGHLAAGLIDPRAPLMGVVSGINMIVNGVVNFGRQPSWIGALRLAATVATGLTIILGSITALAGVVAAIMTAITIVSLGTAAPITGPIIAFCATVMTTVGGWTFWVGLIAAALQALTFIADLWQAGTAQTADQLQQQSETMTEDARNAGNALLQAGMGRLAQVGGRQMRSAIVEAGGGVRFAAQMGARFQAGARALPGRIGSGVRALPSRIVSGARSLPSRIAGTARTFRTRVIGGARALPGRIIGGARTLGARGIETARALPGRIVGGVRALPARIAQAPSQLIRGIRNLPGRLRQQLSRGFSRDFLIGEDIASFRGARAATAEARAAVFAEASEARAVTSGAPAGETLQPGEVAEVRPAGLEGEVGAPRTEEPLGPRREDRLAQVTDTSPEPAPARETSVRESGHIESDQLSNRQLRNEIEQVNNHPEMVEGTPPNQRVRVGDHEIVEVPGGGCERHSNGRIPIPCPSPFNEPQQPLYERFVRGFESTEDVLLRFGFKDEQELRTFVAEASSERDLVARLRQRLMDPMASEGLSAERQMLSGSRSAYEEARFSLDELEDAPYTSNPNRFDWSTTEEELSVDQALQRNLPPGQWRTQRPVRRGQVVDRGRVERGDTIPERYHPGTQTEPAVSLEAKNYLLDDASVQQDPSLMQDFLERTTDQARRRATQLPPNAAQIIRIDLRGQSVSTASREGIIRDLVGMSDGALRPENIFFID